MTEAVAPPQALDAEENVLGAMMLSEEAIGVVAETLRPQDFYRASHGIIFQTALDLSERSVPVDVITVLNELESKGKLEAAGGKSRLQELASVVPASRNAGHYAKIVKDKAAARDLITAGQNIARLGWEAPGQPEELMAQAEEALSRATGGTITSSFEPLSVVLPELGAYVKAGLDGNPLRGLLTGFTSLDYALTGLWPGQLITVAARTGAGKSALAQNIAENVADRGEVVAFCTLEMSKLEMSWRGVARLSGVDTNRLKWGNPPPDAREKLKEAWKALNKRWDTLIVNESPGINPTTLRAQLRQIQRSKGLTLVVVDYIQLMPSGQRNENRTQEVSAVTRSLKLLAKDLGVPVIALSQMSRAIDHRAKEERRPQLSDLRESGSIEQDSDVVMFVHRSEEDSKGGTAEIIIAKNRSGETGSVTMSYVGRKVSFFEIPKGVTP